MAVYKQKGLVKFENVCGDWVYQVYREYTPRFIKKETGYIEGLVDTKSYFAILKISKGKWYVIHTPSRTAFVNFKKKKNADNFLNILSVEIRLNHISLLDSNFKRLLEIKKDIFSLSLRKTISKMQER